MVALSVEARFNGEGGLRVAEQHFGYRLVEVHGDRWVQPGYKLPGRAPVDPTLVQELQAQLEAYLNAGEFKPKQPVSVEYIQGRIKAGTMSPVSILRKVVSPVYQKLWPK
jgi:hypothetical protein